MQQTGMLLVDYSARLGLAVAVFVFFLLVAYGLGFFVSRLGKRRNLRANRVYRLLAGSQKAIFVIIGLISALGTLGIDVSALVAGLGLTGFALGFALRDALSNFMAGVLMIIYQPFDIGDIIEILGSSGEVADMNLRYITLRGGDGVVMIPNSLFLSNKLDKKDAKSADEDAEPNS